MDVDAQKYAYLWDGSQPKGVLVFLGKTDGRERYVILDASVDMVLVIEDERVSEYVQKQMLEAGAKVILPKDLADIAASRKQG